MRFRKFVKKTGLNLSLLVAGLLVALARKMPKNSRYYYDFCHFSNEGCELVAEILYGDLAPILARRERELTGDREK